VSKSDKQNLATTSNIWLVKQPIFGSTASLEQSKTKLNYLDLGLTDAKIDKQNLATLTGK